MQVTTDELWIPDSSLDSPVIRRRLLRESLGLAPIQMEFFPRSLLAGVPEVATDAPFAIATAGRSCSVWSRCAGLTPDSWADRWLAYEWPAEYGRSGEDAARFDDVFGAVGGYPGMTFLDVLQLPADSGRNSVARLAVAAVLNAAKGLTPPTIFGLDLIRAMWHSYVSLGYCVPTPGVKWYADSSAPSGAGTIIQWLESAMRR